MSRTLRVITQVPHGRVPHGRLAESLGRCYRPVAGAALGRAAPLGALLLAPTLSERRLRDVLESEAFPVGRVERVHGDLDLTLDGGHGGAVEAEHVRGD